MVRFCGRKLCIVVSSKRADVENTLKGGSVRIVSCRICNSCIHLAGFGTVTSCTQNIRLFLGSRTCVSVAGFGNRCIVRGAEY